MENNETEKILAGRQVVNLAYNLPGPVATAELSRLGASVIKVEPPGGDPFGHFSPAWYQDLVRGQEVLPLDLKSPAGKARLDALLAGADLLITSFRPSALHRLGLGWEAISQKYPRLCHVEIIGFSPPEEEKPGHDLTYQAEHGLVAPPGLPRSLYADLFGAQRAVQAALALLLGRETSGRRGRMRIYLDEAVEALSMPLRHALTGTGQLLGGGLARYNLYKTRDGWIALAALEDKFWHPLLASLGLTEADATKENLDKIFIRQDTTAWLRWAQEHDFPLSEVK